MRSDNTFLKLVLLFSLLGILVSGWLLSTHIRFSTGQAGLTETCSVLGVSSEGCANVAVSAYSDIAGVPLASIAMGFYFSLLFLVFWAMRNYQAGNEALYVSFFLSTISILVTVTMFYLSRFVVKSFCIGCSILWVTNLAIWPCLVKHLKLRWGNAVLANLELIRPKEMNLKQNRVLSSFALALICVIVFSVIGLTAKSQGRNENPAEETSLQKEFEKAPQMFLPTESAGGFSSKGTQSAPIMDIVEFADFQCPGCRMAAQFLKAFVRKNGDKVRVTYHSFPLDGSCNGSVPNGGHRLACSAARAAICAGAAGKFWEMHDQIFDNQESLSAASFAEFAGKIGLDSAKYEACLKDPGTETLLQRGIQWGDQIQLESTPTMIINGRKLAGAKTPQSLEALLQQLESGKK